MPYKLKELLDTAIENNSIEGTVLNNKYTFIAPNGNIAQFDSFNSLRDAGIVIDALQAQKDGTLEILNNGHVKIRQQRVYADTGNYRSCATSYWVFI